MSIKKKQEIFNKTVKHLAEQGCRSADMRSLCKYRLEIKDKTYKCSVGIHISDEQYLPEMEGMITDQVFWILKIKKSYFTLYRRLQWAHDTSETPEALIRSLELVASKEKLDPTLISNIKNWLPRPPKPPDA